VLNSLVTMSRSPSRSRSKITADRDARAATMPTRRVVAPAAAGNIPMQLVKTEPAMGNGAMTGISYIQRVNTKGGTAPSDPCTSAVAGSRKTVPYQADYVFFKAA